MHIKFDPDGCTVPLSCIGKGFVRISFLCILVKLVLQQARLK